MKIDVYEVEREEWTDMEAARRNSSTMNGGSETNSMSGKK